MNAEQIVAYCISTHTLTWSVTFCFFRNRSCFLISTHTLTWSVTRAKGQLVISSINFNSHAHVVRDSPPPYPAADSRDFNSHAHVERDNFFRPRFRKDNHFNSHAHVERDDSRNQAVQNAFISTHTLTWSVTRAALNWHLQKTFQLTRSRGA